MSAASSTHVDANALCVERWASIGLPHSLISAFVTDVHQAEIRGAAYVFSRFEDDDGVVWALELELPSALQGNRFLKFLATTHHDRRCP